MEADGKTGAVARLEVDAAHRLATARGLLRRLEDRTAGAHPLVEPGADTRVLPVVAPLVALLPAGGLRRGTTVAVTGTSGATSLMLALLAEASAAGAWVGVIGRPDLGLVAAAEAGVALERVALVPYPGADLVAVAAALLDGLDLVVLSGRVLHGSDRARLAARARQRGAVLLPLGPWPGADVELSCERGSGGAWVPGRATSGGCVRDGCPCGCVDAVSLLRAAAPDCCCPGPPACQAWVVHIAGRSCTWRDVCTTSPGCAPPSASP